MVVSLFPEWADAYIRTYSKLLYTFYFTISNGIQVSLFPGWADAYSATFLSFDDRQSAALFI